MEQEDYYDRVERWSSSVGYSREIESLLDRLDLPPGKDLLDIGSGTGAAMRFASRRGIRVIGIDKSPTWARNCAERPVVQADAARLPFRDATFDGVLLFHVLAHLVEVETCLSEVHRVLRSGGLIAISTPNAEYLDALNAVSPANSTYVPDPTVLRHFTTTQVETLLSFSGFLVRFSSTFDSFPKTSGPSGERLFFVAERNGHDASIARTLVDQGGS